MFAAFVLTIIAIILTLHATARPIRTEIGPTADEFRVQLALERHRWDSKRGSWKQQVCWP